MKYFRLHLIFFSTFLLSIIKVTFTQILNDVQILPGPSSKSETTQWLLDLQQYREETLKKIHYSGHVYDTYLNWTSTSFVQPQMMIHDRYFFDPIQYKYTVDKYLDDLEERYGGIDSVLIWPGYPNIGVDNRNQYDLWRDMPGGIDGIRSFVRDFHDRNVKVLFPYYPWDSGTRKEGQEGSEVIPKLLKEIGADGFNCDTCKEASPSFWKNSLKSSYPIAIEPEGGGINSELYYTKMSWGYWGIPFGFTPLVDKWKWLESRHMTHICWRWAKDRTDQLQSAYFNGCGYESWENVWSIFMGFTERNGELLRRISSIQRFMGPILNSKDWIPHILTKQEGIFASYFPFDTSEGDSEYFWTFVNRNKEDVKGGQIEIDCFDNYVFYDVYHGVKVIPKRVSGDTNTCVLEFDVEGLGIGGILHLPEAKISTKLFEFLEMMKEMTKKPLSDYSNVFSYLKQTFVVNKDVKSMFQNQGDKEMVSIPLNEKYLFRVKGIEIEGPEEEGVDVQYPWEDIPSRTHEETIKINSFLIDKYPVTNMEYHNYIVDSKYTPRDANNYLRFWENGSIPKGAEKKPVTWISYEEAEKYCNFYGKRLPNEYEWQYAAQDDDERIFPWGNDFDDSKVPVVDKTNDPRMPDDVDAHEDGGSFFGVQDMVGNVWQWTNIVYDEHTGCAIVRGGSMYYPQGSHWYFPNTYRLDEHNKRLLMAESYDRSGYIGFRCAKTQ